MKQLLFVCFFVFHCLLICQTQQPFSIFIQDSVVVMKKSQDVVPVNIIITKHVEKDFPLKNFVQFIKKERFYTPYVILDGKIIYTNEIGLGYYIENEQGELIDWIGYTEIFPIKIIHTKQRKEECVDIRRKKIIQVTSCDNHKISSLTFTNTYFTVYPMIKHDYLYKELKKEKNVYLTVYYMMFSENGKSNSPIIIQSNKIKLMIK